VSHGVLVAALADPRSRGVEWVLASIDETDPPMPESGAVLERAYRRVIMVDANAREPWMQGVQQHRMQTLGVEPVDESVGGRHPHYQDAIGSAANAALLVEPLAFGCVTGDANHDRVVAVGQGVLDAEQNLEQERVRECGNEHFQLVGAPAAEGARDGTGLVAEALDCILDTLPGRR